MADRQSAWTNMGPVAQACAAAARAAETRCASFPPDTPANVVLAAALASMADALQEYAEASNNTSSDRCLPFGGPGNRHRWFNPTTGEWGESCGSARA